MTEPTAALDAGYIEARVAETGCPEMELWKAVLRLAGEDLFATDETIRAAAVTFFLGDDLPLIVALAGMSSDEAPWLRRRALELVEAAQATPTGPGKRITFRGQTRTLTQWAEVTGVSIHALGYRLRTGWSIEQTLTTPGRRRAATTV